jgi:hypothetical protein
LRPNSDFQHRNENKQEEDFEKNQNKEEKKRTAAASAAERVKCRISHVSITVFVYHFRHDSSGGKR